MAGYSALWSVYWLFKLLTGKEGMGYGDFAFGGAWRMAWLQHLPMIILFVVAGRFGFRLDSTSLKQQGIDKAFPSRPLPGDCWLQAYCGAMTSWVGISRLCDLIMAIIIGLGGGIASGKTTVANLFNEHFNIDIVDADIVAREVVALGSEGLKQIVAHFGGDILLKDGTLNRAKLREVIFTDPTEKQWLNDLHPMIRDKIDSDLFKITSLHGLLVAPLLVENQMQGMADRVLIVDVPAEVPNRTDDES